MASAPLNNLRATWRTIFVRYHYCGPMAASGQNRVFVINAFNGRFAPAIQPFSLLLKFLKAAGGLMQAECPAWGWETDWQMPGGYAGKAALHLVNELRLQRAQSGPHLQKDRTGWKENRNTSVRDQRNAFFARGDATPRMGPLLKESFPANT